MKNKVCWYFNTKYSIEYVCIWLKYKDQYILEAHVKKKFNF